MTTADLELDPAEVHRMATIYDVTEFATALKPWLLETLLSEAPGSIAYLDPDIRVYSSLDVVAEAVVPHGLVFTPHTTQPMPRDGLQPTEQDILMSGTYNLGFVALDERALAFLHWWQERLRRDCLHEVGAGLFVDQRWVDLAVHYFPFVSLKDEGCNVAYWNVDSRPVRRTADGFVLDRAPLRFFHFSGYRPESPHVLSRHHISAARLDPTSTDSLRELCVDYSDALTKAGYDAATMGSYGFTASLDGVLLSKRVRRRYRAELVSGADLPDPFAPEDVGEFRSWSRRSRSLRDQTAARLPVRARLLAKAVDDPSLAIQVLRSRVSVRLGRHRGRERLASSSALPGVNVVGYFHAEDGVGHGARVMVECLEAAGVEHSVAVNRSTPSSQNAGFVEPAPTQSHGIDIVCANADMFGSVLAASTARHGAARYTVGVWAWEVSEFPESMRASADLVDEVWTLSQHSAAAIAPVIDKPVLVFPYPVLKQQRPPRTRQELGLPEGFLFLFCFDVNSVVARKNPEAVVKAFRQAFSEGAGPQLVIKAVNGEGSPALSQLRESMAGRSDLHLRTAQLPPAAQADLMASADCYVSLHRAEGLGLTLAEAMANGTPVIATGYSGNLEFMSVSNSHLVPYELVPIPPGCDPYPVGATWAEPDVEVAAAFMREVFDHPDRSTAMGLRGRADVEANMTPLARKAFLHQRLQHIARQLEADA
jgi:glycosyltransferase involved in cell wall biosynthesis